MTKFFAHWSDDPAGIQQMLSWMKMQQAGGGDFHGPAEGIMAQGRNEFHPWALHLWARTCRIPAVPDQ